MRTESATQPNGPVEPRLKTRNRPVTIGLAICLGFHAIAVWFLIRHAWFFLPDAYLWVAVALPLSQCSLAALWAVSSRANVYLRFAVPLVGAVVCWYVLTKLLPWGIGEPASAAWAISLGVQALAIVIMVNSYQRVWGFAIEGAPGASGPNRSRFAFDLRTLILWTTAVALALGFIQYGRRQWLWTAGVADWEYFDVMPMIGVFNALLAVLWLWALAAGSWQWRTAKSAITVLSIASLGFLVSKAVGWIAVGTPGIGVSELMALAAAQSILVVGSVAFVRLSARVAGRRYGIR
jgi:hypothetical protein